LKEAREFRDLDEAALKLRMDELAAELQAINKRIEEVSADVVKNSRAAQQTRSEAERRREDVARLKNQLKDIKADRYQATEQLKLLRDQLIRIRGENNRLENRNESLKATGSTAAETP
jgi:chromosome segregation ATPase